MKQTEQLNNQCMTRLVMVMGGTASQDGNLAQLSKVSKEKPPKKETSPGPETFSKCNW